MTEVDPEVMVAVIDLLIEGREDAAQLVADEPESYLPVKLSTFAAPGPPPRPGLVWNDSTHRWRSPHTGAEQPHAEPGSGHAAHPPVNELATANDLKKLHPGVTVREDSGGNKWVVKSRAGRSRQVANESVAGSLGEAAGVQVAPVHHVKMQGSDYAIVPFTEGKPLTSHKDDAAKREALKEVPKDQIDRHALFDYLLGSSDPNDGNYLVSPDGKGIVALDKEQSLSLGLGNRSDYRTPYILGYRVPAGQSANDYQFNPRHVAELAQAGARMADHLESVGRKADAAGVRRRAAVLASLAKSGNPVTSALIDAAGRQYDRDNPPPGPVRAFLSRVFGR